METTTFGSKIKRRLTDESLSCFESMNVGDQWQYLTSSDNQTHHSVWINREQKSLLEFCEGDVFEITAPDDFTFNLETQVQIEFCDSQR